MNATCRLVARRLPLLGGGAPGGRLDGHVGTCLTCQAEAARYRKLAKTLAAMTLEVTTAPEGLLESVDHAIDGADVAETKARPGWLGRVAAASGAVAAAGVVAVALWRRGHYAA